MPRRVKLPTADDLFRATGPTTSDSARSAPAGAGRASSDAVARPVQAVPSPQESPDTGRPRGRRPSGRVRHDEKMTVYVTAEELLDIEAARLTLRREHGLAVDRGRLVREAIALVLHDLEQHGADAELVHRLQQD